MAQLKFRLLFPHQLDMFSVFVLGVYDEVIVSPLIFSY